MQTETTRWLVPLIPLVFCLHLAGGQAPAPVNLLPQGDFKNPGATTGWADGFNIPQNQEFRVVTENGKSWLRIENRDAGRQLSVDPEGWLYPCVQFVKVGPDSRW